MTPDDIGKIAKSDAPWPERVEAIKRILDAYPAEITRTIAGIYVAHTELTASVSKLVVLLTPSKRGQQ